MIGQNSSLVLIEDSTSSCFVTSFADSCYSKVYSLYYEAIEYIDYSMVASAAALAAELALPRLRFAFDLFYLAFIVSSNAAKRAAISSKLTGCGSS
jgi:hypothetical protein